MREEQDWSAFDSFFPRRRRYVRNPAPLPEGEERSEAADLPFSRLRVTPATSGPRRFPWEVMA